MQELQITSELLSENALRIEAGLTDTLPEWAVHKIKCFMHRQYLLEHPEFTFTCKKTNEKVTSNHPDFHFRLSLDGNTVQYCLFVQYESGEGFESLELILDNNN